MTLFIIILIIVSIIVAYGLIAIIGSNYFNGIEKASVRFHTLIEEFNDNAIALNNSSSIVTNYVIGISTDNGSIPIRLIKMAGRARQSLYKTQRKLSFFRCVYSPTIEKYPHLFDTSHYNSAVKNLIAESNTALQGLNERITPAETLKLCVVKCEEAQPS